MVRGLIKTLDSEPTRLTTTMEDTLLFAAIHQDVMARDAEARLVRHHAGLCHHVARRYAKAHTLDDAIAAAMEGLTIAIQRYDPARGTRFSTYAIPWITMKCRRSVSDTSATIRIPEHMIVKQAKVARAVARHKQATGKMPSTSTIADETGLGIEQVDNALDAMMVQPAAIEDLTRTTHGDLVGVSHVPSAESMVMASVDLDVLHGCLDALTPYARTLVVRYYGLDGMEPETLSALASARGCTKQAVDDRLKWARGRLARCLSQ